MLACVVSTPNCHHTVPGSNPTLGWNSAHVLLHRDFLYHFASQYDLHTDDGDIKSLKLFSDDKTTLSRFSLNILISVT